METNQINGKDDASHVLGGKTVIHCPVCRDNARIRSSQRKNLFERIISLFGSLPYRCGECGNRFMLWNRNLPAAAY
jgi:hypothetical protein